MQPAKPEIAPQPRTPLPQAKPESGALPPPRLDTTKPATAAPTPIAITPASYSVWGGYAPNDGTPKPVVAVPMRNGTYGSPELRLSRDYHFLDSLVKPLGADAEEKLILRDQPPAADRYFVQGEFLLWWVRQSQIPALATTADNQMFGFFGQPGTTNLVGPGGFGSQLREGFRVRAGGWIGDGNTLGLDGSFFFLGSHSDSRALNSDQYPTILRPIFSPNLNSEFGELVAFPGLSTGTLSIRQTSDLWGADVNLRKALLCGCDRQLSAFAGFRYLNLHESLTIQENLTAGPNAPDPAGTQIQVQDRFDTRNQFYGGQLGTAFNRQWDRFTLNARASVALGATHESLDISGYQVRTRPGEAPQTYNGGLLAAGPNIGQLSTNRFAVVPELSLNAGYYITPQVQLYAGYNFLYWSSVLRPGAQIDRVVDLTNVPNAPAVPPAAPNHPSPSFQQSGFWAQGVQFGVGFRW